MIPGNLLKDTVGGTWILSVIPCVLIMATLFLVARTFLSEDSVAHAQGKREHSYRGKVRAAAPAETPASGGTQERPVQRDLEGQFIDVKAARSKADPDSGRGPGDFLSDISLAFDQGLHSGLVYLDDVEEEVIFQDWRRLVDSSSLGGLTLRNRKVLATGIERYEIGFHGTPLKGWILLLHTKGRWFIVGVGNSSGASPSLDNETLHMLEMLKTEHDRDSWSQPDPESNYGG